MVYRKSTSAPVEKSVSPASVEMSNAEVKSRKRRKRRKVEWGDASDGEIEWAKSLTDCQLVGGSYPCSLLLVIERVVLRFVAFRLKCEDV